uniref:Uncharacterized protein n=1 Tax=Acidobacterium capsulatum TaxID=33075 RepID=A0A7V4XSL0_9BACT
MARVQALLAADQRSEELRYLTEHYRDLQGMRSAPGCALLLAFSAAGAMLHFGKWTAIAGLALIGVASALWGKWCTGWYERRYGVVAETDETIMAPFKDFGHRPLTLLSLYSPRADVRYGPARWKWWALAATGLLFLAPLAWFYSMPADSLPWQIELNICLYASVFLLLPVCLFEMPASRFVWLRRALYMGAIVGLAAENWWAMAHLSEFANPGDATRWLALAWIAAVMLCVTAYDHWLFQHLLTPKKEPAS